MKKLIICFLFAIISFVSMCPACFYNEKTNAINAKSKVENQAQLKITSKAGLLLDYETGNVLFEKNADERLPIASMTKLATLAVVFDLISKGVVKESDDVVASKKAAHIGGSSAFLDTGSTYKVGELIKSIIIASANDSSIALAEHVSGSEEVFVSKMNKLALGLNLKNTNFVNCTGLPAENHYSSAKDIAEIYKLICNNEIYKKHAKVWLDEFVHPSGRKTKLTNTNKLIKTYEGIEGGKTGFTNAARFCLIASARRGNLRLIGVVIGANDTKIRSADMTALFDYGFSNFDHKLVLNAEIPVTIQPVLKTEEKIEVYPKRNVSILINKLDNKTFTTDFKVNEIKAPVKSSDVVGKLFVFDENNMVVDEVDLIVKKTIDEISFKERLRKLTLAW